MGARAVVDLGQIVRVDDVWIDVIAGPPDQPYRVPDFPPKALAASLTAELPRDWSALDA